MFELVISVCALLAPASCKDVHISTMENLSGPLACMRKGQFELSRWHNSHPDWTIKKWRCAVINPNERDT